MTSEEATDLFHLSGLWQNAYIITLTNGTWTARRHENPAQILTADSASGLRWQIRNDFAGSLRQAGRIDLLSQGEERQRGGAGK
ncbi:MAG TPA: hypothetical protein VMC03_00275 [Streptosporangiaceae bacterium]|nr:hypothetical protein [Streptosporangiaceae bacterium]